MGGATSSFEEASKREGNLWNRFDITVNTLSSFFYSRITTEYAYCIVWNGRTHLHWFLHDHLILVPPAAAGHNLPRRSLQSIPEAAFLAFRLYLFLVLRSPSSFHAIQEPHTYGVYSSGWSNQATTAAGQWRRRCCWCWWWRRWGKTNFTRCITTLSHTHTGARGTIIHFSNSLVGFFVYCWYFSQGLSCLQPIACLFFLLEASFCHCVNRRHCCCNHEKIHY